MKAPAVLFAAIAFDSVVALGQGQFLFNTHNFTGGNMVDFSLNGQPATGSDLFLEVFAGPDWQHLRALVPLLPLNQTGENAGYPNPLSAVYTVPNMAAGQSAFVGYLAYRGSSSAPPPMWSNFQSALRLVTLTEPPASPNEVVLGAHTTAVPDIYYIPEPSTWALLLLGLGSLVFAFTLPEPPACPQPSNGHRHPV